jgi:polyhydroxyalkanoate synthesis regulator phasin
VGLAVLTKEKMEEAVQELIKQGEVSKEEGKELLDNLMEKAESQRRELSKRVGDEVQKVLGSMGLVRKEDLDGLQEKIQELEERLRRLEGDN